jgi:Domain of unknown function (DUF3471)
VTTARESCPITREAEEDYLCHRHRGGRGRGAYGEDSLSGDTRAGGHPVDPRRYEDYVGYYDFGNRYVIHVRREGERLMSYAPERPPRELLPETETRFFVKGERVRITFHRNDTGRVDHALFQWWNGQEKAFYAQGDLFHQPALAETLRKVAAQGAG